MEAGTARSTVVVAAAWRGAVVPSSPTEDTVAQRGFGVAQHHSSTPGTPHGRVFTQAQGATAITPGSRWYTGMGKGSPCCNHL